MCDATGTLVLLCDDGGFKSDVEELAKTSVRLLDKSQSDAGFYEDEQVLATVLEPCENVIVTVLIDLGNDFKPVKKEY